MDRLLTALITIPTKATLQLSEQSINNIIILKQVVGCINPVYEALGRARSTLLATIRDLCMPAKLEGVQELINHVINSDITYQKSPLDLRNQRCYAVKSGVNGLLDVARQTYKEATADVYQLVSDLRTEYSLSLNSKFESSRGFYLRLAASEVEDRPLPPLFVNVIRRKNIIECTTLELMKRNAKATSYIFLIQGDKTIQELIENIRGEISALFRICEGVAMLDMVGFRQHLGDYHDQRFTVVDCIVWPTRHYNGLWYVTPDGSDLPSTHKALQSDHNLQTRLPYERDDIPSGSGSTIHASSQMMHMQPSNLVFR
ncbi:MAG: MutS protein msh4 [Geoglossum simile]|nr:MAG: MutS protein msh4 [Geoglossum simile]